MCSVPCHCASDASFAVMTQQVNECNSVGRLNVVTGVEETQVAAQ